MKETEGKIDYINIDWDYLEGICKRISSNSSKYPKDNWKKPLDIKELAAATIRHARKILQPIEGDPESLEDHAIALGCNGMFINYQLKLRSNGEKNNRDI